MLRYHGSLCIGNSDTTDYVIWECFEGTSDNLGQGFDKTVQQGCFKSVINGLEEDASLMLRMYTLRNACASYVEYLVRARV